MASLIVFVGAGLGGALRHVVNQWVTRFVGAEFPYGVLAINIVGSTLMGVAVGMFAFKPTITPGWRLFLTTGILGGFTTFSAFSLDVVLLYERGQVASSIVYALASVGFSIAGLFAGLTLVRSLVS